MEPRLLRRPNAPPDPFRVSDIVWGVSVTLVIGLGMILSMLAGWRWVPTLFAVANARVQTTNGWASAFAVQDNRIAYVGDDEGLKHWVTKDTRVINGKGKLMVTPGFFDSHVHLIDAGLGLSALELRDVTSKDAFVSRVAEHVATKTSGQWILGGGWDNTLWGGELPSLEWIDATTASNPAWLCRIDGHMCLANSLALHAANVTSATAVVGGEVLLDRAGKPTGILIDNAMHVVSPVIPLPSEREEDDAIDCAVSVLLQNGITSVHHMGGWDDIAPLKRAHASGRLKVRVKASLPLSSWKRVADMVQKEGAGDSKLRFTSVKGFADGSLGSMSALMFSSYGTPSSSGLQTTSTDDLYTWIKGADAAGLQPCIHAIGDRANSIVLDVFERVIKENKLHDARRFRIEHAQHIQPTDFDRFAELGVVASMQPYHLVDDGRWAEALIGTYRSATSYALNSMLRAGVKVAAGSDWSVAPCVPLLGIHAAVTRRTLDGLHPEGWIPEQKITVEEALRAYTADAAYADFEEAHLGTIAPGMLADLTVLSQDITTGKAEDITNAQVLMTVVGGKIMYDVLNEN